MMGLRQMLLNLTFSFSKRDQCHSLLLCLVLWTIELCLLSEGVIFRRLQLIRLSYFKQQVLFFTQ